MKNILIAILITITTPAFAGGEAVQGWWDNEYKSVIEPQQERRVEQQADERCIQKIERMEELVEQYPEDAYFQWKLDYWLKKCGK